MIRALFVALLALFTLTGCNETAECDAETPCLGADQVCVEGSCITIRCATSEQCPIDSYCSAGQCLQGCRESADCVPGTVCNVELGQCEEQRCLDTQLDCGFRERCNPANGECYDDGRPYCRRCDPQGNWESVCGEGNGCWNNYCTVSCDDTECPSGFQCVRFDRQDQPPTFQCITNCAFYEDQPTGAETCPIDDLEMPYPAPGDEL